MDEHFVSFVGTQHMGVLNALEGCLQAGRPIKDIRLYATPRSFEIGCNIRDWCQKRGYPPVSLEQWSENNDDIRPLVAVLPKGVLFNVEGGMNFAVGSAAAALVGTGALFVISGTDSIVVSNPESGLVERHPLPRSIPVADVLRLQNVAWEKEETAEDTLCSFWRSRRIQLPGNSLENVRIGGLHFDLVWNDATNRLHFLTNMFGVSEDETARLEQIRTLCAWASTRLLSGQIYDRLTTVLCISEFVVEHVRSEGRGKICAEKMTQPYSVGAGKSRLNELLHGEQPPPVPMKGSRRIASNTLVVALGHDAASTMNAMASHGMPNVLICHTGDAQMKAQASKLRELYPGVKTMETDLHGTLLPRQLSLAEGAVNVQVNVSPGTKGHSAFLAWWAARHSAGIYSLNLGRLSRLDQAEPARICRACDPLDLLRVRHSDEVKGEDWTGEDRASSTLLRHMRGCLNADGEWSFRVSRSYEGVSLRRTGGKNVQLVEDGSIVAELSEEGGGWLENLTAHAVRQAGAHAVYCRVSLPWSEDISARLFMKYGDVKPSMELDVLAAWKNGHVMVSCKSNPDTPLDTTVQEARNVSAAVSRFVRPVVCHMCCPDHELFDLGSEKILVIGWRMLCQPDRLAKLLDDYMSASSTTRKGRVTEANRNTNR